MVCFALLGGLPAGASLAGERAAPGWVHIGAKRRMCCAPAQLRSAKSARSLQRGFMQIVGVSNSESAVPFNLEQDFIEARVESVTKDADGHKVILKLMDSYNAAGNLAIQVYIGEFERQSIGMGLKREAQTMGRPLTYDLMKTTVETLGYEVTAVCVTNLLNSSYHARVVLTPRGLHSGHTVSIDARPSDAINLALRFRSPIYVKKEIARRMARPILTGPAQSHSEIEHSCREALRQYSDPTLVHKVNLQVAIAEERYSDAAVLRDCIERMMKADRALTLMVAIETALSDKRYEEAAYLRDEFKRVLARQQVTA